MSTLPVQGTRIIIILAGYCNRMEPARSAAVYPQKLQQNEIIIGSKSSAIKTSCISTYRITNNKSITLIERN